MSYLKATFAIVVLAASPAASAQLIELGAKSDSRAGVHLGGDRPEPRRRSHYSFTYRGYESGHWHTEYEYRRTRQYDPYYDGYDCHTRFQYTWDEYGDRVRYTSTFCYDKYDRARERRGTRVIVKIK